MPKPPSNVLTPREAEAVRLIDEEGMKFPAVAEIWTVTAQAVRAAYRAGKAKLKRVGEREAVAAKLHGQAQAYLAEFDRMTDSQQNHELAARAGRIMAGLLWRLENDPDLFTKAALRDLGTLFGQLAEKRQLLRGEPTQITRLEDVRKLDELTELVRDELERRQRIVEAEPVLAKPAKVGQGR